jgi:hypothetical protein
VTSPLLAHLRAATAFDHQPTFGRLRDYHVPFESLIGGRPVEARLEEASSRSGRAALIGPSGCGKSSVISYVLDDESKPVASLVIPVASVRPELMSEPTAVADRMIHLISRTARDRRLIGTEEERRAVSRAATHRVVTLGRDVRGSVGVNAGWFKGQLATDLARQADAAVDITPEEKLETINQVITSIEDAGLHPVLVFDDTDRWISGKGIERPEKVVESFFGRVVRWVADLGCGLVVAVHNSYLEGPSRAELLEPFDTPIEVPLLPHAAAATKVLERRLAIATTGSEFAGATSSDVFEDGAIERLFEMYAESGSRLRWLIRTVHMALTESCDAGDDLITVASIEAAGVADI